MVWLFVNKQLKPVRLRLGTSDGTNTEVLDGERAAGWRGGRDEPSALAAATQATAAPSATSNPLMGPQRGGPGGRGGAPGGGGRGF